MQGSYLSVLSRMDAKPLQDYCREHQERFPLLAMRLAAIMLQRAADGEDPLHPRPSAHPGTAKGLSKAGQGLGRHRRQGTGSLNRNSAPVPKEGVEVEGIARVSTSSAGVLARRAASLPTTTARARQFGARAASPLLGDLSFLSFANVAMPPPAPWVEAYGRLMKGVAAYVDRGIEDEEQLLAVSDVVNALDIAWYAQVRTATGRMLSLLMDTWA